jgi:nicotinate phosphoribosyltransferase
MIGTSTFSLFLTSGKINDVATFDLFFRKNPFKGEFTIFAGLGDCLALLENFHYSDSDIAYLRTVLPPSVEDEFYIFLQALTPEHVKVYALPEGNKIHRQLYDLALFIFVIITVILTEN